MCCAYLPHAYFSVPCILSNTMQGKSASQSSTELCCLGGDASRAVDGDPSQNNYNFGSCTHTQDGGDYPAGE